MEMVISVCVVIFTVVFVVLAIEIIGTLKKIKTATDDFDRLIKNLNERVEEVSTTFAGLNRITSTFYSFVDGIFLKLFSLFKKDK